VGWYLRSKVAPGVVCALEHGGVAPLIVDETANLEEACAAITKGGFYHAGQVCVSVQRVFAHHSIKDKLASLIQKSLAGLKTGDPKDPLVDVGPLILPREVDRVESWVEEAVSLGAKVLAGGKRLSESLFEPTLIEGVPNAAKLKQSEVFGPVVCLDSYDDIDSAIRIANSLNVAFQASIFTNDLNTSFKAMNELNAMAVMVNEHTAFRVDWMPFGGYKESGLGIGGIAQAIEDMSIEKLCVFKSKELN